MLSKFPRDVDFSEVSWWKSNALDPSGGDNEYLWSIFPYFCEDWCFELLHDGCMTYVPLHVNARDGQRQRILTFFLSESQFEEGRGLELVRDSSRQTLKFRILHE